MQIVRTLWGNNPSILSEIPLKPLNNDIVLTFEKENYRMLKDYGYDVYLIDEKYKVDDFYLNKLVLLEKICTEVDFIFLDWDINILTLEGIDRMVEQRKFNVPLYSYPPNYYNDVKKNNFNRKWFLYHEKWNKKLKLWKLKDSSFLLPCFCCFTNLKNESILTELLNIGLKNNFNSCSEEFAFFEFITNKLGITSIEEYLLTIEPLFLYGRNKNYIHNHLNYCHNNLNDYIDTFINKTIKLEHI